MLLSPIWLFKVFPARLLPIFGKRSIVVYYNVSSLRTVGIYSLKNTGITQKLSPRFGSCNMDRPSNRFSILMSKFSDFTLLLLSTQLDWLYTYQIHSVRRLRNQWQCHLTCIVSIDLLIVCFVHFKRISAWEVPKWTRGLDYLVDEQVYTAKGYCYIYRSFFASIHLVSFG